MKTMRSFALCCALLCVAVSARAQGDEFPFSRAVVVNSPGTITSWPITAHITGVHFELGGWRVDFDGRLGAKAWPNVVTPGWDGPLQYTLGLCRHTGAYWTCSAVVEFWQTRLEEEGVRAGAPPNEIAKEWFYDSRWGELAGWQPALGEEVGVFITAGDGRNTGIVFPGTVPQRTAARLIRWGSDVGLATAGGGSQPSEPQQPQNPGQPQNPQQPTQPSTDLGPLQEQIERIYADLVKRDDARAAQLAAAQADLAKRIDNPGWFTSLMGNRYVQLALVTVTTYFTTHQMTK